MSKRAWFRSLTPSPVEASTSPVDEGAEPFQTQAADAELTEHFRLDAILGRRPWSTVYDARETGSGRRVAVRVLARPPIEAAGLESQLQQTIAAAMLNHPNIVPIYRYGYTSDQVWYAMKLVQGRSLAAVLAEGDALELDTCLRFVEHVASAVAYAHGRGVVHGAIHPGNILLDPQRRALVTDFMIARLTRTVYGGDDGDVSRAVYAAPEETDGRHPTPQGDQYALAATTYEGLTGEPPFIGDTPAASRVLQLAPPRLADRRPDLPAWVSSAVSKALSPRPEERFPTILDYVSALRAAGPLLAPVLGTGQAGDMRERLLIVDRPSRRRLRLGMAALAVLIGAGGLALGRSVVENRSDPGPTEWVALSEDGKVDLSAPVTEPRDDSEPVAATEASESASSASAQDAAGSEAETAPAPADAESAEGSENSAVPASKEPGTSPPPASAGEASGERSPAAERGGDTAAPPSAARSATGTGDAAGNEPAHLYISSRPWGEVQVDGRPVGNTPLLDLPLPPGRHVITVIREGFLPLERVIFVEPGMEIRLTDLTLEERP